MRLADALAGELLKARRSKIPPMTALGFSLAPLVGSLFMYIAKDPERARELGLLGQKAQLFGAADWPVYLELLAQTVAVGGLVVFAIVAAWVFGREFADRTARTLLATPIRRRTIVVAKTLLVVVWCAALSLWVLALGVLAGFVVGLPGWSAGTALHALLVFGAAAAGTILLQLPTALIASLGRGYLAPLGWAIFTVVVTQVVAALGWGAWFPWAVPAIHSGMAGPEQSVGAAGWALVGTVAIVGLLATIRWWETSDHAG